MAQFDLNLLSANPADDRRDALPSVPQRVRAQGWRGPIIITEMGAEGQWQAPSKPWGASIEPSSTEKAARLRRYLKSLVPATEGQILFYWGQKQEVTATWHGLLLPDGSWTEAIEAMAEAWGGTTPGGNHAPRIGRFDMEAGRAVLEVTDPDGDSLIAQWLVTGESTDPHKGGDAETAPKVVEHAVVSSDLFGARLGTLPAGQYRLFINVKDGKGAAATANVPFQVK